MGDENRQAQLFELEALESVLRENKLTKTSDWSDENAEIEGVIEVCFESIANPEVEIIKETGGYRKHFDIAPPVRLKFRLPKDYPSTSSPHLTLDSEWMTSELTNSCREKIEQICADNIMMEVLFMCYQAIIDKVDSMPTRAINLSESQALQNKGETIDSLEKKILAKVEEESHEMFNKTLFDCEVCYENLLGQYCIKFNPCSHIFCKQCIFDYYRSLAGGIMSKTMQCLGEGCKTDAPFELVKEAIGEPLYTKYENAMLEKAIRNMDDTVNCPRESCQKVAYVTDRKLHLGECSYCNFSFCNLCKQTYHGVSGCKWKKDEKMAIVKMWQTGSTDEKADLVRQFGGEKNVETLVERFLNEDWLESNSKPCPKCSVSIEKNEGCHKMHCTKCDTYFCWLCSETLDKVDPYKHFQGDGTCSGRLFEGVVPNDDDDFLIDPLLEMALDDAFDDGSDYEDDDSDVERWLEEEGHFSDVYDEDEDGNYE